MLDKTKFAEMMTMLCEVFGKEPTKPLIAAYYMALKDMTQQELERAIEGILTKKFNKMPLPAEILEFIHGNLEDRAMLALEKVERAMRDVGGYRSVVFDDPVIHMVIESFDGGWPGLCAIPEREWKFARKDFLKLYQAMSKEKNRRPVPKLVGIHEHINQLNGCEYKGRPVVVGDRKRALAWTQKVKAIGQESRQAEKLLEMAGV